MDVRKKTFLDSDIPDAAASNNNYLNRSLLDILSRLNERGVNGRRIITEKLGESEINNLEHGQLIFVIKEEIRPQYGVIPPQTLVMGNIELVQFLSFGEKYGQQVLFGRAFDGRQIVIFRSEIKDVLQPRYANP